MSAYHEIAHNSLWKQNAIIAQVLGLCPTLAVTTTLTNSVSLGLATARHIVADHGGDIRARSRPGEGSTFLIRLPRSYSDAREVLSRLRRRTVEASSHQGSPSGEEREVEKE